MVKLLLIFLSVYLQAATPSLPIFASGDKERELSKLMDMKLDLKFELPDPKSGISPDDCGDDWKAIESSFAGMLSRALERESEKLNIILEGVKLPAHSSFPEIDPTKIPEFKMRIASGNLEVPSEGWAIAIVEIRGLYADYSTDYPRYVYAGWTKNSDIQLKKDKDLDRFLKDRYFRRDHKGRIKYESLEGFSDASLMAELVHVPPIPPSVTISGLEFVIFGVKDMETMKVIAETTAGYGPPSKVIFVGTTPDGRELIKRSDFKVSVNAS